MQSEILGIGAFLAVFGLLSVPSNTTAVALGVSIAILGYLHNGQK